MSLEFLHKIIIRSIVFYTHANHWHCNGIHAIVSVMGLRTRHAYTHACIRCNWRPHLTHRNERRPRDSEWNRIVMFALNEWQCKLVDQKLHTYRPIWSCTSLAIQNSSMHAIDLCIYDSFFTNVCALHNWRHWFAFGVRRFNRILIYLHITFL